MNTAPAAPRHARPLQIGSAKAPRVCLSRGKSPNIIPKESSLRRLRFDAHRLERRNNDRHVGQLNTPAVAPRIMQGYCRSAPRDPRMPLGTRERTYHPNVFHRIAIRRERFGRAHDTQFLREQVMRLHASLPLTELDGGHQFDLRRQFGWASARRRRHLPGQYRDEWWIRLQPQFVLPRQDRGPQRHHH